MSYILEALRKAERERQLGEAPSVPDVLSVQSAARRNWLPWLAAFLMLAANLGLVWHFGLNGDTHPRPSAQSAARQISAEPAPASHPVTTREVNPARADLKPAEPSGMPAAPVQNPQGSLPRVPKPAPKPLAPPAAPTVRQASAARAPLPQTRNSESVIPSRPNEPAVDQPELGITFHDAPSLRAVGQPGSPSSEPAQAERPSPWRRDADYEPGAVARRIPSLDEMPAEIQENVPAIKINVLAYSSVPEERFAVINMVKYNKGEKLPGGALLKDIQADGLVLELNGKRFRVSHPR